MIESWSLRWTSRIDCVSRSRPESQYCTALSDPRLRTSHFPCSPLMPHLAPLISPPRIGSHADASNFCADLLLCSCSSLRACRAVWMAHVCAWIESYGGIASLATPCCHCRAVGTLSYPRQSLAHPRRLIFRPDWDLRIHLSVCDDVLALQTQSHSQVAGHLWLAQLPLMDWTASHVLSHLLLLF